VEPALYLSLRQATVAPPDDDGVLVLQTPDARLVFEGLSPGLSAALRRLGTTGDYEDRLAETVEQLDGAGALAGFHYHLQRLAQQKLLECSARQGGQTLATLTPIAPRFVRTTETLSEIASYALSEFAYLHVSGGAMVLESPLAFARVTLHDWRSAAVVHTLARPRRVAELPALIPGLSTDAAAPLLTLLLGAGMLRKSGDDGSASPAGSPALATREFHDLLFHAQSREGRHDSPLGRTYRMVGRTGPPPALKGPGGRESLALFRPDLERLLRDDPPFASVQESRRSIREYSPEPITVRRLGEFLYRVGRAKECSRHAIETPRGTVTMDFALRPHPGGGALYELELYPVINACEGLERGLYHYEPGDHRLGRVSGLTADAARLLTGASQATGIAPERLQVLVVIAARFPRV
jgi:hypothetical protein